MNIFEKLKSIFTDQNTKLTAIADKLQELEIGRGGGVGQVDATPGLHIMVKYSINIQE